MRTLVAALAFGAATWVQAGNLEIKAENLHFVYDTVDGTEYVSCTHELENADAQDWKVLCTTSAGKVLRYSVHLWVTTYAHATAPKFSVETLFWVTDHNVEGTTGRGNTSWFHFNDETAVAMIEQTQWLENGDAELRMSLKF